MRKYFIYLFLFSLSTTTFSQFRFGEAKGLFMAVGVGPRFPIFNMSNSQNIGTGFNVTFSYTDNEFLPIFFYSSIGYNHFPGRQDLYKKTDYSSLSSNVISVMPGVRYYFKPIFEQVIILMPVIDVGAEYCLFEKWHQFKIGTNKKNFVEEKNKFGFHLGVGASMFLLDFITYYNYMPNEQFISVDLKVNLPIFVKI
ncbi:MAG: hypothetical protein N2321_11005 [Melioribacteraceae bacterium]|nr:hypothetical protein [Melioribacteraceae bacterium]